MINRIICVALFISAVSMAQYPGYTDSTLNMDIVGPETEAVPESRYQKIYYVAPDAGDPKRSDGSRENPWPSVNGALARITDAGPENRAAVLVAAGIYRDGTIHMKPYIDLFGGFSAAAWERDIAEFRTILSGDHVRRVVVGSDHSRIDGLVITAGISRSHGGGMLCEDVSPEISNNIFTGNAVLAPEDLNPNRIHQEGIHGGALACLYNAVPVIRDNLFYRNRTAVGYGGAVVFYGWLRMPGVPETRVEQDHLTGGLRALLFNNAFVENRSGVDDLTRTRSSSGGAVACAHEARPLIRNNVLTMNDAGGRSDAGGLYCEFYSDPVIMGNWIVGNRCDDDGGGIYTMRLGHPRIIGNIFAGNMTTGGGAGAIRLSKEGRADIRDNVIVRNPGGGVICVDSYMRLENNLIIANHGRAGTGYSSKYGYFQPTVIGNNYFLGNEPENLSISGKTEPEPIIHDNIMSADTLKLTTDSRRTGNITEIQVQPATGRSRLTPERELVHPDKLTGRVIRIGSEWTVIVRAEGRVLTVWGDITHVPVENRSYEILPRYEW